MTKRIFRAVFLVSALALAVGLAFLMVVLYQFFGGQLETELKNEASYLSIAVENDGAKALEELPEHAERVTLISKDGDVLFDNRADASDMENHAEREEIREARERGYGQAVRTSNTLAEKTVYYALRLENGDVLRISSTQYTVAALLGGLLQPVLLVLIMVLILSGIFASRASKKIVKPLNELDLDDPEANETYDEVAPLLGKIRNQQRTIQQQLSAAKRQQQEFSIITENMSEGLLVIDKQTDLLSFNSSALRILGAKAAPQNQSVLTLNRSEPFRRTIDAVLAGGHRTELLQVQDGFCQLIANPVLRRGEVAGAVLLLVDVTERIQRENLRREFTANVSHELKTPLTSISGFAEIIQDGFVKQEDIKKFAGKIFDEAQRLIVLVGDVIKISQLDEGCLPYEEEEVDLFQAAGEILQRLHDPAQERGVSLHLEGDHIIHQTVKPILEEILYNLCENGIKYNREGGSVTVTVRRGEDGAEISVKDTGIGIPKPQQERIFERFYRVDKSHSKEVGGTGLGLSIVKHGAAYLGAGVSVHSEPGQGSEFILAWRGKK